MGVISSSNTASINLLRLSQIDYHILAINQSDLRANIYQGLADAVKAEDANRAGKRFILPGSFMASSRSMAKLYHDAMASVRKIAKPTLFVIFR